MDEGTSSLFTPKGAEPAEITPNKGNQVVSKKRSLQKVTPITDPFIFEKYQRIGHAI